MARKGRGLGMVTVTQYAEAHQVSTQRVRQLLSQGRIAGAVKVGPRMWLIPEAAPYPEALPGGKPAHRGKHEDPGKHGKG